MNDDFVKKVMKWHMPYSLVTVCIPDQSTKGFNGGVE
jgi:hypothetical protein